MRRGFTLIELLLTLGIIGVLAAITIVAINPLRQLGLAEDARRHFHARQIEKAIAQFLVEYEHFPGDAEIPEGIENAAPLCRGSFAENAGCINIDGIIDPLESFLPCMPRDGREEDPEHSGYAAYQQPGRVTVIPLYLGEASGGSTCDPLPSPLGHWSFNMESEDLSPHGFDVVPKNMANVEWTKDAPGGFQIGNITALDFDGLDDYVSAGVVPDLQINGDLTLAIFANYDTLASGEVANLFFTCGALGETQNTNFFYTFALQDDRRLQIFWETGNGTDHRTYSSVPAPLTPGTWAHIAMTRNTEKKEVKFYVNGVQLGTTRSYGSNPAGGSLGEFNIGSSVENPAYYSFDGALDDPRIYPFVLSEAQILSLAKGNP